MTHTVRVGGKELRLSNLDKLLWPAEGIRKAHLIEYYLAMAPYLLPHLRERPLTFTRYPDGIEGESFYQKDCPEYAPDWIRTYRYKGEEHDIDYVLIDDEAGLVWLGNQACLEIHPAPWRAPYPDRPDRLVIDLDPAPPASFDDARRVAAMVGALLERLGVRGYLKTSGATGLHVFINLIPEEGHAQVTQVAETMARILHAARPDLITLERLVKNRTGKVYVDYLQNSRGKIMVAPYSPRPRPGAPVSVPITWEELASVKPEDFSLLSLPRLMKDRGDPAAGLLGEGMSLGELRDRIGDTAD